LAGYLPVIANRALLPVSGQPFGTRRFGGWRRIPYLLFLARQFDFNAQARIGIVCDNRSVVQMHNALHDG